MGRLIDLTGKRFGRLKVLRRNGSTPVTRTHSGGFAKWLCQCKCGNQVTVRGVSLRAGRANSCKCQNWERLIQQNKGRRLPGVTANQAALLRNYKNNMAKNRGLAWSLSDSEFGCLVKKNCYYCGALIYNGIDRLENAQGYTIGNCVPCCGTCNRMKQCMTMGEFYSHIIKIASYREAKGEIKCQLAATA